MTDPQHLGGIARDIMFEAIDATDNHDTAARVLLLAAMGLLEPAERDEDVFTGMLVQAVTEATDAYDDATGATCSPRRAERDHPPGRNFGSRRRPYRPRPPCAPRAISNRKSRIMTLIDLTPTQIPEPDWSKLLSRRADRAAAAEHWRLIVTDMRDREILSPVNAHAIQRLVLLTVMHDRAAAKAMRTGPVSEPKAGNPRAIARPSLYFAAMREAGGMASQLEDSLGLSPRTRNKVAKVPTKRRLPTGADKYLKSTVTRLGQPVTPIPSPLSTTDEKEPTNG